MRITRTTGQDDRRAAALAQGVLPGLLVLAFALGVFLAEVGAYDAARTFAGVLWRRPGYVLSAWRRRGDLPTLTLDLAFNDYQRLASLRSQALEAGAYTAREGDAVPAQLNLLQDAVAVEVQLLAGSADALAAETRWPLELAARDGGRAKLVPATEDALLAWGYLRALQQEGVWVPDYRLVRLWVNGKAWGAYALETLPSVAEPGLAARAPDGVLVFFATPSPAAGYAAAQVTAAPWVGGTRAARRAALAADPQRAAASAEAVARFRALEAGHLAPGAVFDAERLGRFLALSHLWRGAPALDWRTLRWLYDPATGRFEPLGVGAPPDPATALPPALLDDSDIQRAYALALADLADPAYRARWREAFGATWDALYRAVGVDLGYPTDPWALLRRRQAAVAETLAPPATLHAEVREVDGALHLRLEAVVAFPVVVAALDFGERGAVALSPDWVEVADRAALVGPPGQVILPARVTARPPVVHLRVPGAALPRLQGTVGEIRLLTHIWGADAPVLVTAQEMIVPDGADE